MNEINYLLKKKSKTNDYIIKQVSVNKSYNYEWSYNDDDEITHL